MNLCEQYYEGDVVPLVCEGCRQVRCPRVVDIVFASPKGGSVEEKPNPSRSIHGTRSTAHASCSDCRALLGIPLFNQVDYL